MKYTIEQSAVVLASRNRMQIRRQYGLSFQAVEVVLKLANLQAFENPRATQADVARVLGIDRSRVCQHLKRAEALKLVVRVGRAYFFRFKTLLSLSEQADLARKAAMLKRQFERKAREIKQKLGFVAERATHTANLYLESAFGTVAENKAALAEMYIPPHLRKAKQ